MKLLDWFGELDKAAKVLLTVAVMLVGSSLYHSCNSDNALAQFRHKYEVYRDSTEALLKQNDVLKAIAKVQHDSAEAANAKADLLSRRINSLAASNKTLHHSNDSLTTVVLADTTVPPEAKVLIANLEVEVDSLTAQVVLDSIRDEQRLKVIALFRTQAETNERRADVLEAQLRALPNGPKKEKLLGLIPLPSRQTSFFVGLGVGVVSHVVVNKLTK